MQKPLKSLRIRHNFGSKAKAMLLFYESIAFTEASMREATKTSHNIRLRLESNNEFQHLFLLRIVAEYIKQKRTQL